MPLKCKNYNQIQFKALDYIVKQIKCFSYSFLSSIQGPYEQNQKAMLQMMMLSYQ